MRLLLDNNLAPRLAEALAVIGFDAVHISALDMRRAPDSVVLDHARADNRVLVSADTDFGALLAASRATAPSVVLLRRVNGRRVPDLATILADNLPVVAEDLALGAVVVLSEGHLRIRRLPLL